MAICGFQSLCRTIGRDRHDWSVQSSNCSRARNPYRGLLTDRKKMSGELLRLIMVWFTSCRIWVSNCGVGSSPSLCQPSSKSHRRSRSKRPLALDLAPWAPSWPEFAVRVRTLAIAFEQIENIAQAPNIKAGHDVASSPGMGSAFG